MTSACLLPILRSAVLGDREFSRSERIFYTVCEFRAAIAARALASHLGSDVLDTLQDAVIAFSEIGARGVADTLNRAVSDIAMADTRLERQQRLGTLESELNQTTDPVDQLIARYAEELAQGAPRAQASFARAASVPARPPLKT
jgi:predicted RecB family endonuclease